MAANRWLRPEFYVEWRWGSAASASSATSASTPKVNKEGRSAGVLENFEEGRKNAEHALRKFVRNRSPEIMPSLNSFFARPK